ncbi:hypothetical protein BFS06_14395 [Clostridium perfringens]|uniref:Uncharacterized protein n=1 Tax=Clostridium perfringens TaxID=1502 RepID=A0A140GRD1_CLOPF|nr:hypothetical protein [Clostridium perfringens]AMN31090.1 hypothetical protein JFP838_pA0174 [Clostridium perfringens]TBX14396.1 hypothetical protein BFS06_14395 [Clostridium perfringens]
MQETDKVFFVEEANVKLKLDENGKKICSVELNEETNKYNIFVYSEENLMFVVSKGIKEIEFDNKEEALLWIELFSEDYSLIES